MSEWFVKKRKATEMRKCGLSIVVIEKKLRINRSTLSGWFKNVKLTENQKKRLENQRLRGLVLARSKAVEWHRSQKKLRLEEALQEAKETLRNINTNNPHILDLALAMLYLGEGLKQPEETGMGNTDPLILKMFLSVLKKNYNVDIKRIRCELHLRADQNSEELKKFWSKELKLPIENFKYVSFDERTKGSPSYEDYKGVCVVRYGDVAIKRKLINISREFCESIIK